MTIKKIIDEHIEVISSLNNEHIAAISAFAQHAVNALKNGKRIYFMGNGGSAADSQHLAAEFVGRFKKERRGLPAVALTTDTSILTSVGNDYDFQNIFSRQVEALVNEGDVVVGISTSGNSKNVVNALTTAKEIGAVTIGLTGAGGGVMNELCDVCIKVPSKVTARIQEGHIMIGHIICELVDEVFADVQ